MTKVTIENTDDVYFEFEMVSYYGGLLVGRFSMTINHVELMPYGELDYLRGNIIGLPWMVYDCGKRACEDLFKASRDTTFAFINALSHHELDPDDELPFKLPEMWAALRLPIHFYHATNPFIYIVEWQGQARVLYQIRTEERIHEFYLLAPCLGRTRNEAHHARS